MSSSKTGKLTNEAADKAAMSNETKRKASDSDGGLRSRLKNNAGEAIPSTRPAALYPNIPLQRDPESYLRRRKSLAALFASFSETADETAKRLFGFPADDLVESLLREANEWSNTTGEPVERVGEGVRKKYFYVEGESDPLYNVAKEPEDTRYKGHEGHRPRPIQLETDDTFFEESEWANEPPTLYWNMDPGDFPLTSRDPLLFVGTWDAKGRGRLQCAGNGMWAMPPANGLWCPSDRVGIPKKQRTCNHILKEFVKPGHDWEKRLKLVRHPIFGVAVESRYNWKKRQLLGIWAGELLPESANLSYRYYGLNMDAGPESKERTEKGEPRPLPFIYTEPGYQGNWPRFMNHSCVPNCQIQPWRVGTQRVMVVEAIREIRVGQELTFDYTESYFELYENPKWLRMRCKCGEKKCRFADKKRVHPKLRSPEPDGKKKADGDGDEKGDEEDDDEGDGEGDKTGDGEEDATADAQAAPANAQAAPANYRPQRRAPASDPAPPANPPANASSGRGVRGAQGNRNAHSAPVNAQAGLANAQAQPPAPAPPAPANPPANAPGGRAPRRGRGPRGARAAQAQAQAPVQPQPQPQAQPQAQAQAAVIPLPHPPPPPANPAPRAPRAPRRRRAAPAPSTTQPPPRRNPRRGAKAWHDEKGRKYTR